MDKTLVIMAAGMGSRFGGDKQITSVGPSGEMLMEYTVFDSVKAGFTRIIFVIRSEMRSELEMLVSKMRSCYPQVEFIFAAQNIEGDYDAIPIPTGRRKPLGTVHALLSAAPYINSNFTVLNADDYYGRKALARISSAMEELVDSGTAAMIYYGLRKTLSRHGAVTRGLCSIENGYLIKIRESYKVTYDEDIGTVELLGNEKIIIPESSPVSMNLWAFHRDAIPLIKKYFRAFLLALPENDNISECLLPLMTEDFIQRGIMRVVAYPTECRWFGLTYKEDIEDAAWELDKRHQDGTYPDKLF